MMVCFADVLIFFRPEHQNLGIQQKKSVSFWGRPLGHSLLHILLF